MDEKGNVQQDTKPVSQVTDPKKKAVVLTWLVLISSDQTYYKDHVLPLFKKCIQAISGSAGKKFRTELEQDPGFGKQYFDFGYLHRKWNHTPRNFIVEKYASTLKYVEGVYFDKVAQNFQIGMPSINLNLECQSAKDEIISGSKFSLERTYYEEKTVVGGKRVYSLLESGSPLRFGIRYFTSPPSGKSGEARVVSPFFLEESSMGSGAIGSMESSVLRAVSIEIPIDEIKNVSKVNFDLEISPDIQVILD